MGSRVQLHQILKDILESNNVYFQPPQSLHMQYPAIVYKRNSGDTQFASNKPYIHVVSYTITVIDPNPDSFIPNKIAMLPMCIRDRFYTADNLNHDVFSIYF